MAKIFLMGYETLNNRCFLWQKKILKFKPLAYNSKFFEYCEAAVALIVQLFNVIVP